MFGSLSTLIIPSESRETHPGKPASREGECRVMDPMLILAKHILHKEVRMSVYTKRQRIAKIAKQHPEEPITLLHHYIDEEWLTASFYFLPKDKAPGIDQQTWQQYEENLEENIKSLLNRAKSGSYKAPPVRRTKIPKPGSKEKRKLGIPTTEDKVLQKAVLML